MRARRGISLFEAIASLAIVAVTTISALATVGAEMRTSERARRAIEVEALLSERVNLLNLATDRELQSLPDSIAEGQFDAPLDGYTWTTESAPHAIYPGLYDVTITLRWMDGSSTVHTAQYRRPPFATRGGSS